MNRLLELRKKAKKKMPDFVRQGYSRKKGLGLKWRRPRGRHSKMRRKFKGKINPVTIGYRSPKKVRGLDNKGRQWVIVHNTKELTWVKGNVMIDGRVGKRKKVEIIKKAMEMGVSIININNPKEYLKMREEELKNRKKSGGKVEEKIEKKEKAEVGEGEREKQEKELKRKVLEGK